MGRLHYTIEFEGPVYTSDNLLFFNKLLFRKLSRRIDDEDEETNRLLDNDPNLQVETVWPEHSLYFFSQCEQITYWNGQSLFKQCDLITVNKSFFTKISRSIFVAIDRITHLFISYCKIMLLVTLVINLLLFLPDQIFFRPHERNFDFRKDPSLARSTIRKKTNWYV